MSLQPWITLEDITALVTALEAAEFLDDRMKRTMLVQLTRDRLREDEPAASFTPDRPDNGYYDLLSIVRRAAHQRGAIRALADAMQAMAPDEAKAKNFVALCRDIAEREPTILNLDADRRSLRRVIEDIFLPDSQPLATLYARAMPTKKTTKQEVLWAAVLELASLGSARPLFRFLEIAAAAGDDEEAGDALRKWSDDHHGRLTTQDVWDEVKKLRAELMATKAEPPSAPGLMIRLDGDTDTWCVTAWIWTGSDAPTPNIGPSVEVTWSGLEAWLSKTLTDYAGSLLRPDADPPPLIEFVLPARQLGAAVDALKVALPDRPQRLGESHLVSVRPDDRSAEGSELLRRRWPIVAQALDRSAVLAADSAWWVHSTVEESIAARQGVREQWAWLAITCPRMAAAEATAHAAVLGTGAPIAVWVRGEHDFAERQESIRAATRNRPLDGLPTAVRSRRKGGWNKATSDRDLVLMWDDPNRPPPPRTPLAAPRS